MKAQNSIPSAALPKQQSLAAVGCQGPLFQSSTNFILPLGIVIGFFPSANWLALSKCINVSLKW